MIHAVTKKVHLDAELVLSATKVLAGVLWKGRKNCGLKAARAGWGVVPVKNEKSIACKYVDLARGLRAPRVEGSPTGVGTSTTG